MPSNDFRMYHIPLRPYEKAYIFWYIESLKPFSKQDPKVIQEKYAFGKKNKTNTNA